MLEILKDLFNNMEYSILTDSISIFPTTKHLKGDGVDDLNVTGMRQVWIEFVLCLLSFLWFSFGCSCPVVRSGDILLVVLSYRSS